MSEMGLPCVMNSEVEDVFTDIDRYFINGFCRTLEELPNLVHMVQSKVPYNVEITEFKNGFWVHGFKEVMKRG